MHELVKIVCVAVVAEREKGKTISEVELSKAACYTPEQLMGYLNWAESEVAKANREEEDVEDNRRTVREGGQSGVEMGSEILEPAS